LSKLRTFWTSRTKPDNAFAKAKTQAFCGFLVNSGQSGQNPDKSGNPLF